MRIEIHPHAYKHGLTSEQILFAYQTGSDTAIIRNRDRATDPPRWACIGFDRAGNPIELVFIELLEADSILIFHANKATRGFINEIRKGR